MKSLTGGPTPPPAIPRGKTSTSQKLAYALNQANREAYNAEKEYRASAPTAAADIWEALAAVKPGQNAEGYAEVIEGGESFAKAVLDRRERDRTAQAAAAAQKKYDNCRSSTSCWNGSGDGDPVGPTVPVPTSGCNAHGCWPA